MAATGFTPIQIYYSTTASAVPTAGNLLPGELALNIADMKLYCENGSGVVTLLASASGASGDVVGPASAVANNIALFDGTTGKLIKDGGQGLPVGTIVGASDSQTLTNKTINGSNNTITNISLTTAVTGTLPVANGGTGQTSYTDGQLLIGNTATTGLTKATLTAGSNVTITNGNGTITIASTNPGGDVVGPASATDNAIVRFDGTTGKLVQNSAVTVADTTGDITGGAYNKVTITAPATSATLTIADGKTLTANNSITLSGTDATTMTFPSTSATIARTDAGQTFTGTQVMTSPRIVTSINDTNGNEVFAITATASAVNDFTIVNAAVGNNPQIQASGSDSNIGINLVPKGTGTVQANGVPLVTTTGTQTLTNKRIDPRASSTASITSPLAWNSDNFDLYAATAQAGALTINADSGTPVNGQKIIFRFKDNGTARALTWTTGSSKSFQAVGITLPTTTVINKTTYVGCIYNAADDRWDAVATVTQA